MIRYPLTLDGARDLDSDATARGRTHAIAACARDHGCLARVVRPVVGTIDGTDLVLHHPSPDQAHVLVVSPDGSVLATRSAERLLAWLGY